MYKGGKRTTNPKCFQTFFLDSRQGTGTADEVYKKCQFCFDHATRKFGGGIRCVQYAEENTLFFMQGPRGGPRFFYIDATNVLKKFQDHRCS